MLIYIDYLPKDILLYELWANAKKISQLKEFDGDIQPSMSDIQEDLRIMHRDNQRFVFKIYYGRYLFIDVTDHYLNPISYNIYNGPYLAERIIDKVKLSEINKSILRHYTSK